jgi:hypothetical protein
VSAGTTRIIECGPGKVLTGLNRRIAAGTECLALGERTIFDPSYLELDSMSDAAASAPTQVALVTGASRGIGRAIAPRAGARRACGWSAPPPPRPGAAAITRGRWRLPVSRGAGPCST